MHKIFSLLGFLRRLGAREKPLTDPLAGFSFRQWADLPHWHAPAGRDDAGCCR